MTMYDVIYEELQDRVDCGMLALEDAEIINDLAYERYVDAYEDDDITLEDAMDYIDDVLTEAASRDDIARFKKEYELYRDALYKYKSTVRRITDCIKNANVKDAKKQISDAKSMLDKIEELVKGMPDNIPSSIFKRILIPLSAALVYAGTAYTAASTMTDDPDVMYQSTHQAIKSGAAGVATGVIGAKTRSKSSVIKKKALKNIAKERKHLSKLESKLNKVASKKGIMKESVDDLRLRVYEAHNEGLISESEKDSYLDYLDLNNYE